MEDITPELLREIQRDFQSEFNKSKIISGLYEKVRDGTATYAEANDFAIETGKILANAYGSNLSSDVLPDGRMYYNIAQRIINPTMVNNYNLITDVTDKVQQSLNEAAKIGIKPVTPEMNQNRVDGIINRVANAEHFDDVAWILDEPIVNFSQSIVDDSIRRNAEFHADAGMKPVIVRKLAGGCCEWCAKLAGTYTYPDDVPHDVYRRHQRCRCTVDYNPRRGKIQNVHSKKWQTQEERERVEVRKKVGMPELEKSHNDKLLEKGYTNNDVIRTGTNEVDMAYIRSEEYMEKFRHISDNEDLNNALYRNAITLLDENKGSDTEGTFIFDAKKGKTILKRYGEKNTLEVKVSDRDLRIIRNQKPVVGMHNHPTNLPPNGADFTAAGYREYDFGVIVTHDGRIFKYKVGNRAFHAYALDMRIDKYMRKEYNLGVEEAFEKALNEFRKEYGISWQEIK